MSDMYVLDERGEPKRCNDVERWAQWFAKDERRAVRKNTFRVNEHEVTVSTVFLGMDHNWSRQRWPILWETMIFGLDGDDQPQWRYSSRDDAIRNHERLVDELLTTGSYQT